jgi:hypothetical protein
MDTIMVKVNPLRAWCNHVDNRHTEAVLTDALDVPSRLAAMDFALYKVTYPLTRLLYPQSPVEEFAQKDLALFILHSVVYLAAFFLIRLAMRH